MNDAIEVCPLREVLQILMKEGWEGLSEAMSILFNEAMKAERAAVLRAEPYQRTSQRRGYANGYKPKRVKSRFGELLLQIPQVRGDVEFYPSALDKGERSERALKLAMAEMYIKGVTTRRVSAVLEKLCGTRFTAADVSRTAKALDEELERWRNRPLGRTPYLILDARYEKVRMDGSVVSCAVLTAVGVRADGRRSVLGTSVSVSEAEVHWREFLLALKERGLHGLRLITSDEHAGLRAALETVFSGIPWQRCQTHLQRNAAAFVPKEHLREEVARDIRSIFDAPSREEAERLLEKVVEKYRTKASRLSSWLEENIPEGLTVFLLPPHHRRRLRTTNMLERLHREIKRRTRVSGLFPNEAALLRLVSAVLMETSEEWESAEKVYLKWETDPCAG